MKKSKYLLLSVMLMAAAGSANAATSDKTITGAGCDQAGTCWVNFTPALLSSDTTCSNKTQVRWAISDASGKNWLATGLTARAAAIKVNFGLVANTCAGNFAKVNFMSLK